jgi:hypothetical protein
MIRVPKWLVIALCFAVFLMWAGPASAAEEMAKGKIKTLTADKNEFVLTDANGKDWTFQMERDAKIRLNNEDSKLDQLKEGDEVRVTYEKLGDKFVAKEIRCTRK